MDYAKLGVVPDLAYLPFLISLSVFQESLLLNGPEWLELEDLSEDKVLRLSLQDVFPIS